MKYRFLGPTSETYWVRIYRRPCNLDFNRCLRESCDTYHQGVEAQTLDLTQNTWVLLKFKYLESSESICWACPMPSAKWNKRNIGSRDCMSGYLKQVCRYCLDWVIYYKWTLILCSWNLIFVFLSSVNVTLECDSISRIKPSEPFLSDIRVPLHRAQSILVH